MRLRASLVGSNSLYKSRVVHGNDIPVEMEIIPIYFVPIPILPIPMTY